MKAKTTYPFVIYMATLLLLITTPGLPCFANEVMFPTPSYEGEELGKGTGVGNDLGRKKNYLYRG